MNLQIIIIYSKKRCIMELTMLYTFQFDITESEMQITVLFLHLRSYGQQNDDEPRQCYIHQSVFMKVKVFADCYAHTANNDDNNNSINNNDNDNSNNNMTSCIIYSCHVDMMMMVIIYVSSYY